MLPRTLESPLREQMGRARVLWTADQARGRGGVYMPDALERKYPRAGSSWAWFWVFPQATHSVDPQTGASFGAITCTTRPFSARSRRQSPRPA